MTPPLKLVGLASCTAGLVLASVVLGPGVANASTSNGAQSSHAAALRAVSEPRLTIVSQSSGSVTISVQAPSDTLVRFKDDAGRLTSVRIGPSGVNTTTLRVDDGRLTKFEVTAVLNGETVTTPWSVDTRDDSTPGLPGEGSEGDAPTVSVVRWANDYATLLVKGTAGQTFSVTDEAGNWAGSGLMTEDGQNVSVHVPAGTASTFKVSVKENYQVVGSTTIRIDPSTVENPAPVTPSPEPTDPEGQEPVTPVEPVVPDPDQPSDPDTPAVGEVTVGDVVNGRAQVTIAGPIGAEYMIVNGEGRYVIGGFIEGRTVSVQLVVGTAKTTTFTLHMAGGTKTFTVNAR